MGNCQFYPTKSIVAFEAAQIAPKKRDTSLSELVKVISSTKKPGKVKKN